MGGMSFAYVCHHSTFLVRNSMKEPQKWHIVTHTSIATATVLSVMMAMSGYLSFILCTRGDILNNLESDDPVAMIARLMLALTMVFTFPMEFFVIRHISRVMLTGKLDADLHHWKLTIFWFVIFVILGQAIPQASLSVILELTGGFSAVIIGFVLPGICCWRYHQKFIPSAEWIVAGILLLVGVLAAITSTVSAIQGIVEGGDKFLDWCPKTGVEN
eukprot:NODE_6575_length_836_cov_149.395512_g6339_i0.p1 GENE.NODE_6575_length_836_cov_149.395512_g6339_i0~~NODE_6575_length_836_cov_149.395512_g6339_i0.p1  ORF type:complete len:230 (+),score=32.30 NODE_6575_length_836_cov_149.395512_g6339_i0:45-692(+)